MTDETSSHKQCTNGPTLAELTPRVEAAIGPGRKLSASPEGFVQLAATYSDLLQLARNLERELAEVQKECQAERSRFERACALAYGYDPGIFMKCLREFPT